MTEAIGHTARASLCKSSGTMTTAQLFLSLAWTPFLGLLRPLLRTLWSLPRPHVPQDQAGGGSRKKPTLFPSSWSTALHWCSVRGVSALTWRVTFTDGQPRSIYSLSIYYALIAKGARLPLSSGPHTGQCRCVPRAEGVLSAKLTWARGRAAPQRRAEQGLGEQRWVPRVAGAELRAGEVTVKSVGKEGPERPPRLRQPLLGGSLSPP